MNCKGEENLPVTTSYDYDAPLTEAGDVTPKFLAIREQIKNLTKSKVIILCFSPNNYRET